MTIFKTVSISMTGLLMAMSSPTSMEPWLFTVCEEANCCMPNTQFGLRGELLYWRPELCGLEGAFGNTLIDTTVSSNAITTDNRR